MDKVIAKHRYTIFEKNEFSVVKFEELNTAVIFTVSGYNLPTFPNVYYEIEGEWKESNKYGKSFQASHTTMFTNDGRDTIVGFLSCGLFPCMGLKTALKVYEKFGKDTLKILDENIDRLLEVKGFSAKKLKKFKPIYESERTKKELATFLMPFGIPVTKLAEIEKAYEDFYYPKDIKERIMSEPYILYNVKGITITIINNMVDALNLQKVSLNCFKAYALDLLKANEVAGNTVINKKVFLNELSKPLSKRGFTEDDIKKYTTALIKNNNIIYHMVLENEEHVIGRKKKIDEEYSIATRLTDIKKANRNVLSKEDADKLLEKLKEKSSEMKTDISRLDEVQLSAVYSSLTNKVCVLTGGGGTGKTTVTKIIAEAYAESGKNIICLAPTGRASRRLSEVTGRPASTIHSFFNIGIADIDDNEVSIDGYKSEDDEVYAEDALVIIDEASMLDVSVCNEMIKHIRPSCSVLFVGDVDQLPSVCAGAVLRDIIESITIPTIRLETVYRQKEDSVININAQKIKKGKTDIEDGSDFHFIECEDENLERLMLEKVLEMRNKYGSDNVMCLCPYKEHNASVRSMNNLLQNAVNPSIPNTSTMQVNNYEFRVGDIVMQTTRNRVECSNGDIGIINRIVNTKEDKYIEVEFPINGTTFTYEDDDVNELILAYASTIHKAQGSEALAVVTCLSDFHSFMLKRNFLYTDVSRAREELWIYGKKSAMEKAIKTTDTFVRTTMLQFFLNHMLEKDASNIGRYEQLRFA